MRMAVNLSARQIATSDVVDQVAQALADSAFPPRIVGARDDGEPLVEDATTAAGDLQQLRALGVRLAIDDFGTGYSSLSYLRQFPVDILKIAKPFVDRVAEASHDSFVRMMIDLAKALGARGHRRGHRDCGAGRGAPRAAVELRPGFFLARPEAAKTSPDVAPASYLKRRSRRSHPR